MRIAAVVFGLILAYGAESAPRGESRDAAVWTAIAQHLCANAEPSLGWSVLDSLTTESTSSGPASFDQLAIKDMWQRRGLPISIPQSVNCATVRVVDSDALRQALDEESDEPESYDQSRSCHFTCDFTAAFPGARRILRFGKPGYSAEKQVAVVYVIEMLSLATVSAYFWQLRERDGVWVIDQREVSWIA